MKQTLTVITAQAAPLPIENIDTDQITVSYTHLTLPTICSV